MSQCAEYPSQNHAILNVRRINRRSGGITADSQLIDVHMPDEYVLLCRCRAHLNGPSRRWEAKDAIKGFRRGGITWKMGKIDLWASQHGRISGKATSFQPCNQTPAERESESKMCTKVENTTASKSGSVSASK
eukprot:3032445-Pleurochrysis_carterae.AAC.2